MPILISFRLIVSLPIGFLLSDFPTKSLYTLLLFSIRATCPAHLSILDVITRKKFGEEYRACSSYSCSLLHSPVTSSVLGPDIFLSTLLPKTLSLSSSRNMSDQVSHPYKTIGKIVILYIWSLKKRKFGENVFNRLFVILYLRPEWSSASIFYIFLRFG